MLISFDQISDNARLWVYQANRPLTLEDQEAISDKIEKFTDQWAAHGAPLKSSYKIFHNQFLVLAVDESYNEASGCSIDSSVHLVKEIENTFDINFFDRTKIAFILNEEVFLESLSNIKTSVQQGKISKDTLTFNNLISKKGEMDSKWLVPARNTWLSKYF